MSRARRRCSGERWEDKITGEEAPDAAACVITRPARNGEKTLDGAKCSLVTVVRKRQLRCLNPVSSRPRCYWAAEALIANRQASTLRFISRFIGKKRLA